MKFNIKDLLQKEIPTNKWLVKDDNEKIIRAKSSDVLDVNNLTKEEKQTINRLIDFVRYSQDKELNNKKNKDYLRPAVGLAAPQIGINKNMYFIRFDEKNNDQVEEYAMINAKITAKSVQIGAIEEGEGCLSVDVDRDGIVPRAYKIEIEGYDYLTKKNINLTMRNYKAIVFQHESDHINGNLYYDWINQNDPQYIEKDWIII